jgi:hypothetical protein
VTTANQIIGQALGLIAVRTANDPVSGADAALCFERLNTLVDALKISPLMSWATTTVTATIASGTQTTTIGPTGVIVVAERPIRIESAFYTAGGLDYPMEEMTQDEYDAIALKAINGIGPDYFHYNAGLLNGTLSLYPRPSTSIVLSLNVLTQISEFADLTTDYDLAPGYRRHLAYLLAAEVCPDFERDLTPRVAQEVANSRRTIERMNHVVPQLGVEPTPVDPVARIRRGY